MDFTLLLRDAVAPLRAGRAVAAGTGVPTPRRPAPFARVRICTSLAEASEAWSRLEAVAPVSPYQTRAWQAAWIDTEGRASGIRLAIVVAEDAAGRPVALLPLGIRRRRGLVQVATFLGGRQTNYNMGLFDPALAWTPADADHLLRDAARLVRPRLDTIELTHQPLAWAGFGNPLAGLPRSQPSPSFSHMVVLERDGAVLLRRLQSAAARKKLRAKAAHLAALGPVEHRVAHTAAEVDAVVCAHLAQKAAKLAAIGLPAPDGRRMHQLLVHAATHGSAPLELHALHCGDTIVATFGGLAHAGRFSGLLISYATETRFARCSPGELLLTAVLAAKCAAGFDSFDLGIGEARYKDTYCPVPDPLVDVFLPLTVVGRVAAAATSARLRVKSAIKRSPRAWNAAQTLRRALRPRQGPGPA